MHKLSFIMLTAGVLVSCSREAHVLTVTNPSAFDRSEIATAPLATVDSLMGGEPFRLLDSEGRELPYQRTYDGLLIFPATVAAESSTAYTLAPGTPAPVDTVVTGALYPRRKDDLAWENEHSAYRAYGPELQRSGERAYGYDVWTKSVDTLVVADRYHKHLDQGISFHKDNGNGLDVYTVGPTLGPGTAALLKGDSIAYPWAFADYEILDNGPLRFTARLTYLPVAFDGDSAVVESRLITLDSGEWLNRVAVSYGGLSRSATIAPGIVVHRFNPDGYRLLADRGIMAVADLTDNPAAGNGTIYIGVVAPEATTFGYLPLEEEKADAVGHVLARGSVAPGSAWTYWWGSGWSKGGVAGMQAWADILDRTRRRIDEPLNVTLQ